MLTQQRQQQLVTASNDDEARPLLQPDADNSSCSGRTRLPFDSRSMSIVQPILLLLVMKICSNMFENQMASFDVRAFVQNASSSGGTCTFVKQPPSSMLTVVVIAMATAAFVLPSMGGALSDAFLGSVKVLTVGAALHLCGSSLLTALDNMGRACEMPLYLLTWAPVLLYMGFGDTLLLYAPMQFARNRRTRQLVLFLYFVAAATGETMGNVPAVLRYFTEHSYEFLGVGFGVVNCICMVMLALSSQQTVSAINRIQDFQLPRRQRFIKFYLITAGAIPHLTCITLCRITLYWQQLRFFTKARGDEDVAASYVGLIGYQAATISLSSCAAIAVFRGRVPRWLSLRLRIRIGLCVMAVTKVPLLVVSALDYAGAVKLEGSSSFITMWSVYFIFSFCDGVTNVFTTVAIYEVICCIAEKSAKATFIGIFYTVWGLAILLNGAILLILQSCGVLSLDTGDRAKPKAHFSYAAVICLALIAIGYWEKISWPLAEGLLADHEAEEAEEAEIDEDGERPQVDALADPL